MKNFLSFLFISISTLNITHAQEKGDRAKLVLYNAPTDTLMVNVKNAYPFDLDQIDVASSYKAGKVWFFENGKRISKESQTIKYLEFTDRKDKLRKFTYDSRLDMKNLSEIVISGKISFYINIRLAGLYGQHRDANRFLEKDGLIIHLKGSQKKFKEKIKEFMTDQPDYQNKLDNKKLDHEEILDIIREYNTL